MKEHKQLSKIKANNEYGQINEMFYGRVDDFRIPEWDEVAFRWVDEKMANVLRNHGGKMFSEAAPEWYASVKEKVERVVSFIESKGIIVHRPKEHTETEWKNFELSGQLNINLYSRDCMVTIGDTIVETAFATPERMRNKYAIRDFTMELLRNGNRVISAPQPLDTYAHDNNKEVLLEGGDVEIDLENGYIYIGHSGNAANDLGYLWLKAAFPQFTVYQVEIDTTRFQHQHLDCVMVIFKDWGIILEEDVVGGIAGLPEPLLNRKWIQMTQRESELKLANIIAINENEVIMPAEAERLIKEVEALGQTVHAFPYQEVGEIGGSLRCNTHPIYRD